MELFRAVVDTNSVLAAHRATGTSSPNRELLARWRNGEFILLYSRDVLTEYAEKLLAFGLGDLEVIRFIRAVTLLGEHVLIAHFHFRRYPADTDDVAFFLCALNGKASHLVTYDKGFSEVKQESPFIICRPLAFDFAASAAQAVTHSAPNLVST